LSDAGTSNLRLTEYKIYGDCMASAYLSDFDAYTRDLKWLSENLENLRPKYENKFILVKDKKVISASANYDRLLEDAVKHNIDVSKAVIERIISKNVELLL